MMGFGKFFLKSKEKSLYLNSFVFQIVVAFLVAIHVIYKEFEIFKML